MARGIGARVMARVHARVHGEGSERGARGQSDGEGEDTWCLPVRAWTFCGSRITSPILNSNVYRYFTS